MKEYLWVLPLDNESRFQIRTTDTFACLSAVSSWEEVLKCISHLVVTYKSEVKITERLQRMEYPLTPNNTEKDFIKKMYKQYKDYRREEINKVIDTAMIQVIEDFKNNRPYKKARSRKSPYMYIGIDLSHANDLTGQCTTYNTPEVICKPKTFKKFKKIKI